MYPNHEIDRHQVVVNSPGEHRETITETTQEGPREVVFSGGVIAIVAILALIAVGLTYFVVSNKNANEEANRQAMLEASRTNEAQSQQPAQAPAPAQQPVIIQQPAQPQAPVIVQPPAAAVTQDKGSPLDDLTIQDAATKRLTDNPSLASITVMVIDGRATLLGTVGSSELKAKAEKVVKAVRGVKSVENKIDVSNQ